MVSTRSGTESKTREDAREKQVEPTIEIDLETPDQSVDEVEKKTTESTPMPHMEDQNPKTVEFSPIDALEDTTGNTRETVKDDSQVKKTSFTEKLAMMVGMKSKDNTAEESHTGRARTFGTVSTKATEADPKEEQAKKKGDQLRFCCDFRYLNSVTVKDAYPIPRIDESLSKLGDAKFFTTLDLGSAFWQVPLRKQDRDKTGLACELGLFQWKRMPFGLCNATATFQRLMAHALIGVTKKYGNLVMCYVDDVVIATPTLEDHIETLDEVFACMKRSGLKCKPSKCEILKDSIKYLGRMVDKHGIRPDTDAVEAVLTWKSPKTEHQLMSFLGFANYYREFIKGYADKVYPMQQLMRHKGKKFTWNNAAEESFQRIKKELCEAPVLGMPTEKGMYVLDTDASVVAISGILHQEQEWNGKTVLRPIAYGSKVLSDTEMKYGAPKAEMFEVVTFVEKYRAYLGSEPFKLRVDNRALSWLKTYSMDQSYIGR